MVSIVDPTGFSTENNPHPPNNIIIETAELYNKRTLYENLHCLYFEYTPDGWHPLICHCCLLRAKYDAGNCMDGGDYFQCLKNKEIMKERELKIKKYYSNKKIVQSKLI